MRGLPGRKVGLAVLSVLAGLALGLVFYGLLIPIGLWEAWTWVRSWRKRG